MTDFNDIVTSEPRGDVRTHKIKTALVRATNAGSKEASEKALASIKPEIESLMQRARTPAQKRLLEEYHAVVAVQKALADATLVKLLGAEDEEVQFKAAKELRGGGRSIKVDKGMFVSTREDPEITRLKEGAEDV